MALGLIKHWNCFQGCSLPLAKLTTLSLWVRLGVHKLPQYIVVISCKAILWLGRNSQTRFVMCCGTVLPPKPHFFLSHKLFKWRCVALRCVAASTANTVYHSVAISACCSAGISSQSTFSFSLRDCCGHHVLQPLDRIIVCLTNRKETERPPFSFVNEHESTM